MSASSSQLGSIQILTNEDYIPLVDKRRFVVEVWTETLDLLLVPHHVLSDVPFFTRLLNIKHEFLIIYLGNNQGIRIDYGGDGIVRVKYDSLDRLVLKKKDGKAKNNFFTNYYTLLDKEKLQDGAEKIEQIAFSLRPKKPYNVLSNNCIHYTRKVFKHLKQYS